MPEEKLNGLKTILNNLSNTKRLIKKSEKIQLTIDDLEDKDNPDINSAVNQTKDIIQQFYKEISDINKQFNEFYENEFCDKNDENCDILKHNDNVLNGDLKHLKESRMNNDNLNNENKNEKNDKNKTDNNKNDENKTIKSENDKNYIRCVDIKKLLDKNSTNKNSSVIVLSDSESSPPKKLINKFNLPTSVTIFNLNSKKRINSPINLEERTPTKSVLRTSSSSSTKKKNVSFRDPETSDIDDLPEEPPRNNTRLPRKTKPLNLHDISSLSEDSSDTSSEEILQRTKRKVLTKRSKKNPSSPVPLPLKLDAKMRSKCYVPLVRMHPDEMKKNYEKLMNNNEIKRLTNMHSLKRNRKGRRNSTSSDSSSTPNNHQKRAKTSKKRSSSSSSSDSDDSNARQEVTTNLEETPSQVDPKDSEMCEDEEAIAQSLLLGIGNEEVVGGDEEENEAEGGKENDVENENDVEKENDKEKENNENDEAKGNDEEKENEGGNEENEMITKKKTKNVDEEMEVDEKEDEEDDLNKNKEKSKWRKDKLLTSSLSSSDSDTSEKHKGVKEKSKEKCKEKSEQISKEQPTAQKDDSFNKNSDDGSNVEDAQINQEKDKSKTENDKKQEKSSDSDDSSSDSSVSSKGKNKKDASSSDGSDSDLLDSTKKNKKKKKKVDEETDESFAKFYEKNEKLLQQSEVDEVSPIKKPAKRIGKKIRRIVHSDSDSSSSSDKKESDSDSDSSKSSKQSDDDEKENAKNVAKKRRRIRKVNDDSSDDEEGKSTRKQIRKVLDRDSLAETTIAAEKEEAERKARILEKQKKYNQIFEPDSLEKSTVDKVVLDFEDDKEILVVHKEITKHLKPHQAKGVQFMWDTCFESIERAKKEQGSGCILAHCMGLGKTLQVITLVHTLLSNHEKTKIHKVLVVCPLSTVLNWVAEFKKWLPDDDNVNVFDIVQFKQNIERLYQIKEWDRCGGALVLGYDMFRNLTNATGKRMSKKLKEGFHKYLVDPGPDMVICDEGHLLKNEKTSLSIAMNKLKTLRRIVLTGTPLQNNLKEYWCMVQFVKPNLLGTYKEYLNRFVNPIVNGQYTDSTQHDIQLMRKRSHVLHKLLDGVVQRRDYAVLAPFLPPKYEYVLFVALTDKQVQLYEHYMKEKARRPQEGTGRSSFLFVDFQELQRICTHPRVLLDKSIENKIARDKKEWEDESEGSLKDFIDDESEKSDTTNSSNSSESDSESNSDDSSKKKKTAPRRVTRATAVQASESEEEPEKEELDPLEWWRQFVTNEDLDDIKISGKLSLLFEILHHCENIGDKILIFSQSLYSLNVIEYFLAKVDDATQNSESGSYCGFSGSWSLGLDYFRLDGSSSADNRAAWCNTFNNPENVRARLFLISTRAGGLGINLVAANRVIIFDVSWNPSHDTQSIYRVYRFGQNKPSYIYRFVTMGTMEMKIYERQVIKQAISKRVIDEQQIDRHYNQNDIAELYKFEPKPEGDRPIPLVPTDVLLGELLQQDQKIYKYHEHQSLLENKEDEVLDEAERKAAWEEFENEKKARQYSGSINHIPIQSIVKALTSIVTREQPGLPPQGVQELVPALLQELQEKMALGDATLYNKVLNEIRLMQATVQQQRIEEYYRMQQQQQQNMLLQQYQQQLMSNPVAAAQFMSQFGQQALGALAGFANAGSGSGSRVGQGVRMPGNAMGNQQSNQQPNQQLNNQANKPDIIELND